MRDGRKCATEINLCETDISFETFVQNRKMFFLADHKNTNQTNCVVFLQISGCNGGHKHL